MRSPTIFLLYSIVLTRVAFAAGDWIGDFDFPKEPVIQDAAASQQEQILFEELQHNPDNQETLLTLADLYHDTQYYPQAIAVLERLIELHPKCSQTHYLLGKIFGYQKTDPDRSIEELEKAISLKPDSIKYHDEAAKVYYRLQRFPPAMEHLEKILVLDPNNKDALYRKAVILYTRGEVKEAERITDQLPNHEHARILKAVIVQQRNDDAKPLYESIIKDHPDNLRARYEYGKILMKERKYEKARQLFEKIIDEEPFYQHAIFQLVRIYSMMKEKEKAALAKQSLDTINQIGRNKRNYYRSYLRHHPDTAKTHFAMGLIYLEIGRGNLAADEFQRVLELDSENEEAPFYLAQIYMSSGEFEKAITYLEKCLQVREEKAPIHSLMSQCYLELNNAKQAFQHLETALKLNPNDPLANHIKALWERGSKH